MCQYPICGGITANDTRVCNGTGSCDAPDICIPFAAVGTAVVPYVDQHKTYNENCIDGYAGFHCDIPVCFGILANESSVCLQRGTCTAPDTCACSSGKYAGNVCQHPVCDGISAADPQVCDGNGKCLYPGFCKCYETTRYTGQFCQHPPCFNISANDNYVCSRHGKCIAKDMCQCDSQYGGANCSLPICFGVLATEPSVCNERGKCILGNHCDCTKSYFGRNCEHFGCNGFHSIDTRACGEDKLCTAPEVCVPNWCFYIIVFYSILGCIILIFIALCSRCIIRKCWHDHKLKKETVLCQAYENYLYILTL
jgi:hypothetical protein